MEVRNHSRPLQMSKKAYLAMTGARECSGKANHYMLAGRED